MINRRTVLRGAGATLGAAGSVAAFSVYGTQNAIAASFTASNVSISSNDGTVTTLEIAPSVTTEWNGQETDVATIEYTWSVSTNSTSKSTVGKTPFAKAVSTPAKDGSEEDSFNTISLLSANGGTLSASNFESSTDDSSNDTTVNIYCDITLKDSGDNIISSKTDILNTSYTVSVTNETSSVSTSGNANTSGS